MSFISSLHAVFSFFSALCQKVFGKAILQAALVEPAGLHALPPSVDSSPFLNEILKRLEAAGIPSKEVLEAKPADFDNLAPTYLTAAEVFRLKSSLREVQAIKKTERDCEAAYQKFLPFVGRIKAMYLHDGTMLANGVLIGDKCHVVTALHPFHIVDEVEERIQGKPGRKRKKSELQRIEKAPFVIEVCFPHSNIGKVSFRAKIVTFSEKDDLALLQATELTPKLARLKGLPLFAPYHPQVNDLLIHISYPGCKGEQRFSHSSSSDDDLPWFEKGVVSCYHLVKGEGIGTYTSFGGSSGALVVYLIPNSAQYRCYAEKDEK